MAPWLSLGMREDRNQRTRRTGEGMNLVIMTLMPSSAHSTLSPTWESCWPPGKGHHILAARVRMALFPSLQKPIAQWMGGGSSTCSCPHQPGPTYQGWFAHSPSERRCEHQQSQGQAVPIQSCHNWMALAPPLGLLAASLIRDGDVCSNRSLVPAVKEKTTSPKWHHLCSSPCSQT